ncbi:MAG: CRISPR-associated helicase Cas3' [Raoultibacter sp.]
MMTQIYYAHSNENEDCASWQELSDHLAETSKCAQGFCKQSGAVEWASVAAILHDAGKATDAFQRRLRGSCEKVDHSTAGAKIACEKYGCMGILLAFVCAGHHGGLPNGITPGKLSSLSQRLGKEIEPYGAFFDVVASAEFFLPEIEALPHYPFGNRLPEGFSSNAEERYSFYLFTKMLFSSVVDADHRDTERVLAPERALMRNRKKPSLKDLLKTLEDYLEELVFKADPSAVNDARANIQQACRDKANAPIGIFSLTVPTGGGKTLSVLLFALLHAVRNGQERIIFSVPFTTVTAQIASLFKKIFGEDAVLEHHSNYNFKESEDGSIPWERLAMQDWDAPIVVTTNVQFFESIYASKPSRCRKVHNIANSVVILDEAQALPDRLLKPSLAALVELSRGYQMSAVLCTATQPPLDQYWPFGQKVHEIIDNPGAFKDVFEKRARFELLGECELVDIAERMTRFDQALCIVGTRKAARELYEAVLESKYGSRQDIPEHPSEEGYYHLSALMVPAHREEKIKEIRQRLSKGKPCVVVSTQLIEAGVDIDFPSVFREMAGLDSVMQAAGRCNREGGNPCGGTVFVFDFKREGRNCRSTWLDKMAVLGRGAIERCDGRICDKSVRSFFLNRYLRENLDGADILKQLTSDAIGRRQFKVYAFEDYARDFKFIENEGASVFIPWGREGERLLKELLSAEHPELMAQKLQSYMVNIPFYTLEQYKDMHCIEQIDPFLILNPSDGSRILYRDDRGLLPPGKEEFEELVY